MLTNESWLDSQPRQLAEFTDMREKIEEGLGIKATKWIDIRTGQDICG